MKNKKKIVGNGIFLALIFGLTLYGVFHGEDMGKLMGTIKKANIWYLLPAVVCVVFFIWGESIIIHYLMGTLEWKLGKWKCFLISSVGFFFSCITPSASGGQPMQMVYLKKEKIPLSVSSLVLMVVTITYKLVLVLIGVFLLVFQHGFVSKYLNGIMPVFYLGIFLNVVCVAVMMLLVFHPMLMKQIMMKGYAVFVKLHLIRHKPTRIQKLDESMELYRETANYLKSHFQVVVYTFLITLVQRLVLFAVTYFVYRSFGLTKYGIYDLIMLQAVISVAVDMLPLPGGMGISEKLFSIIFVPVFGAGLLLPGMILSRGLSYYTELVVSAAMTCVAHLRLGRTRKEGT
ncbi:MAG: flippase-like domain-containing protein [Clostridia bacterium]|nr:flippase-like domain-containing protein [Clostridia bacterium]NCC42577.1 flippase-like domain-containing protein [Clostridia bacterium]